MTTHSARILLLFVLLALGAPLHAQDGLEDIFGGLGSAEAIDEDEEAFEAAPGSGGVGGRVVDATSGAGLPRATVILQWPVTDDGSPPHQEVQTTDSDGGYEFRSVPPGRYELTFVKSGYRASTITNFEVQASVRNEASFPVEPLAAAASGEVLDLEAFVVEASTVEDLLTGLETRLDSDQLLNVMSSEDLSRYAASDVADALKWVAGVNVVEGQFAVIRGLEDRYSSTTYNGAPVPSPDPDSQSVQLDLFPSDVVTNLVVAKSFAPSSPSNASAGSIDIVTQDYPEELEIKLSIGAGFEEGARERFLELTPGSTAGAPRDDRDVIETDGGGSIGGRFPLLRREVRFKALVNHEVDYRTQEGHQERREPSQVRIFPFVGSLAFGELPLSDGRFEQTESTREEQLTAYAGLGLDLDTEGAHRVDASFFFTENKEETIDLRENGFFPSLDYSGLIRATEDGDLEENVLDNTFIPIATPSSRLAFFGPLRPEVTDQPSRGALWFASFGRTNSFRRDRDLKVLQLNGTHDLDLLEGLEIRWAANRATTHQDETSLGMRFFYEPCGFSGQFPCPAGVSTTAIPRRFPVRVADLGVGSYFASGESGGIVFSENQIEEGQWFARADAEQEVALLRDVHLNLTAGVWWESSERDVDSFFVETVTVKAASQWVLDSPTLTELGSTLFDRFDAQSGDRQSTTKSTREITAGYVNLKTTLWERLDVLGGVRFEDIFIDSKNDPFTGEFQFNRPATFPPAYLFFDRLDNPSAEVAFADPTRTFNDQILGINVPVNPTTGFVDLLTREEILGLVNGEIDEFKLLPSVGLAYRPVDGLTLRGSYSQTVARPSFREIGYYVSVEPGTDDRTVGNPQLKLSDVESYDFRAEYVYGDLGDLFAFSAFYKTIQDPIESIVVRNPLDLDSGSAALFKTFFNNPSEATLWGVELEGRKSFDFLRASGLDFPGIEALDYLSIGGNFTYIEAEVDRSPIEIARAADFFEVRSGDVRFTGLKKTRRLFGQPEWIANADLSFDHPDWGTRVTLAMFAISDVLEAAGSTSFGPSLPDSNTLDRYNDGFYQLDLVVSQEIWRGLRLKMSVKNLTNTTRRRVYDPEQTRRSYSERSRRSGRDWSFSLGYTHEF